MISPLPQIKYKIFVFVFYIYLLTLKLQEGGGQMALPLNLNAKNLPNAEFFLVFLIDVYFLWASASELQFKTSAKTYAILKE